MGSIRVWEQGSRERENLEKLAVRLNALSSHGTKYEAGETYFDFGQNWKWTTIIATRYSADRLRSSDWQCLSPRDHEVCVFCDGSDSAIEAVAMSIWNDRYNPDR